MALIQNVRLEIVENQGAAAALVTYTLTGSARDVQQHRTYLESIRLFGVDEVAGEDGQDDIIAAIGFDGAVTFPIATTSQSRLLALPARFLDEDSSPGPLGFPPAEDEIRARVTLTPSSPTTAIASSNVVLRGGPVNGLSAAPSA